MEAAQTALRQAIQQAFGRQLEPVIVAAEPQYGDFASNVAFTLAGELKRLPQDIAQEIALAVTATGVEATAVAGYVNLRLGDDHWLAELARVKVGYGHTQQGQGHKVQVEFVSANPTGPLTLGNGRGGYTGDVLANVFGCLGYDVEREYYLNDTGGQITALRNSIYYIVTKELGSVANDLSENIYKGEYINDLAASIVDEIRNEYPDFNRYSSERMQEITDQKFDQHDILGQLVSDVKTSTAKMGITFDHWFSEDQELHKTGEVATILERLQKAGSTEEREGAIWLRGNDDRDRVLVKSDGTYTYLLVDIAYHWNKLAVRQFDKVINLWGADHAGQVSSLRAGLRALDLDGRLDIILFQLVRLIRGGKEYKVSKRAGTYVTIDELIELTGSSDVARFFFLMRSADTQMDFDLDLAKEQSQKNPLFYILYAFARAHSILDKAAERGLKPAGRMSELSSVERELVKKLAEWPQLLQQIAGDYGVHRLTFYGREVAKLFHDLYEAQRIIDLEPTGAGTKLYLVQQVTVFLEGYFAVLGIKPSRRLVD